MEDGLPVRLIGEFAAGLLLLALYRIWADSFDIRRLLGVMLPLAFIALASVSCKGTMAIVPSLLFFVGEASVHILIYSLLLLRSFMYRISSAIVCAAVITFDWTVQRVAETHGLTAREKTVFAFLLDGRTYREIGDMLFISQGTTRSHASRVYSKLGVHSHQELLELVRSASPGGSSAPDGMGR